MALKALMLRKKIDLKQKELDALKTQRDALDAKEADLTRAIDEVENAEEQAAVEEDVNALGEERKTLDQSIRETESALDALNDELAAEEAAQDTEPEQREKPAPDETKRERSEKKMENRNVVMTARDRLAEIVTRDEMKSYLGEVRAAMKEKRALTNVGLTIPEVLLGLIRENIEGYSKLYKHVTVRHISGDGRQLIMGTAPEAIWTDCCANLNELSLAFYDLELNCFKVGGFFAVCNATLEDSDLNLASELVSAIGQAIGLALDKAILYGRNANTTQKMPQGIVSRLVQTEAPIGYPATARPWADLHTTNIITIPAATKGVDLFAAVVTAAGKAKSKYAKGGLTWAMNETTYTALMAAAALATASGQIVTALGSVMPIVGGTIEILPFLADNVIIGGYFDTYVLAERAGEKFATSEHVRFLADQTVFKGTARYDGAPAIAEAFVAVGIGGTTPTATMTFATDTANA